MPNLDIVCYSWNLNKHEVKSTTTSIKWEGFLPELLSLKVSSAGGVVIGVNGANRFQ